MNQSGTRPGSAVAEQSPEAARDEQDANVWRTLMLLMLVALAIVAGRIAVVASANGLVPFLSANDRSRWCTVASLVEDGTYRIDRQMELKALDPKIKREVRTWQTIDRVRHQGTDGRYHDYSSKPPLFPTMIAGVYFVVHGVTGMTLTSHPMYVGRIVLALTNLPLLWMLLFPTLAIIHRTGQTTWGRIFAGVAACFGTMLLPFSVSLNNHLPAAAGAAVALWVLLDADRATRWRWMFVAGLAAAFMAANELPALSMLALFGLVALLRSVKLTLLGFAPAVVLVAVAFFGTNWLAHRSLRPAYAHRGNGPLIVELSMEDPATPYPDAQRVRDALQEAGETIEEPMGILNSEDKGRWMAITQSGNQRYAVLRGKSVWELRQWDDWYEYEGSYWTGNRRSGVDLGEPSRARYLFHMTLGHHGLLSLTPIWCLSLVGACYWCRDDDRTRRALGIAICVASLVCLAFYFRRPLIDRNYGGVSSALRWMLWFAPMWLWLLVPAADKLARRGSLRALGGILLVGSVFSAASVLDNPWTHSWLYRFWDYLGWLAT